MTTCAYDRRTKTIGADSRNTDGAGQVFMCNKIERLGDGRFFLGSGHLLTIAKVKYWANNNFSNSSAPTFDELFGENAENFSMSCLVISADGETVVLVDDEITPIIVLDDIVAVGSGGGSARAALEVGATMQQAIEVAIKYDGNSGGPVCIHQITSDVPAVAKKKAK